MTRDLFRTLGSFGIPVKKLGLLRKDARMGTAGCRGAPTVCDATVKVTVLRCERTAAVILKCDVVQDAAPLSQRWLKNGRNWCLWARSDVYFF